MLCKVSTLKIWSQTRRFCVLGSVSAHQGWVAGQPLGSRRQPLLMKKGLVQWTQEGREQMELQESDPWPVWANQQGP